MSGSGSEGSSIDIKWKGKKEKKHKDKKDKKEKDKKDKKHEGGGEDEDGGKKKKKDKKNKDKGEDKKDKQSQPSGTPFGGEAAGYFNPSGAPSQQSQPAHPSQYGEVPWFLREPGPEPVPEHHPLQPGPGIPSPNPTYAFQPPLPQAPRDVGGVPSAPPSGYRIPLDPNASFPTPDRVGRPPTVDPETSTPVFIGSAIFPESVHPCRIVPTLQRPCRVLHGGTEIEHHGRYDLLPIADDMEWVPAGGGQIPPGRRPIEGGFEPNRGKLYHALGFVQGVYIPGTTGPHLGGAIIPFGGTEYRLQENYSILCWR